MPATRCIGVRLAVKDPTAMPVVPPSWGCFSSSTEQPCSAALTATAKAKFAHASWTFVATERLSGAMFAANAVAIASLKMLAVAIVNQGLDKRLALGLITLTGNKTWRIVVGLVSFSAILSSFIGEHTVSAMMLPVALTLLRNAGVDTDKSTKLSNILLFSIAYGCSIGSIGTPSGGGRNVIMIGYLSDFGIAKISYLDWIKFAYPMLILEIPIVSLVLWYTFTPSQKIMDTAVRKLKVQVARTGKMTANQILAIGIFFLIFIGWIFLSPFVGLGIVALSGVFFYLTLNTFY